jgi:hypothetical protein
MQMNNKRAALILLFLTFLFFMHVMNNYPEWTVFAFISATVLVFALALVKWFA